MDYVLVADQTIDGRESGSVHDLFKLGPGLFAGHVLPEDHPWTLLRDDLIASERSTAKGYIVQEILEYAQKRRP